MTQIVTKKYQNFEISIIPAFSDNYIFLIKCLRTKKIIAVDPGESHGVDNFLNKNNLNLDYIIITHRHFDHISGILELKTKYNCQILSFDNDKNNIGNVDVGLNCPDFYEKNSQMTKIENVSRETFLINGNFQIGEIVFSPFKTFGHCSNHISYFIESENLLFCGDTLFSSGCGRIFSDGSVEELFESLNKIKNLPKNTQIYCTHEYTLNNIDFAFSLEPDNGDLFHKKEVSQNLRDQNQPTIPTILENELKTNPFLRFDSSILRGNLGFDKNTANLEVFRKTRQLKDEF